jgi:HlyD family type I secretion membrane fusion protein
MSAVIERHAGSLTELLQQAAADPARRREWKRQARMLLIPVAIAVSLLAAWSAAAPLAGAVVASAQVRVEHKRKTVQHQEGGIVRQILVRDGQTVQAGDPLLVIGDLRQDADLNLLQDQLRGARTRAARAEAESVDAVRFDAPPALQLDPAAADPIARERAVFEAHRRALREQEALLRAQIQQAQAQAAAIETQMEATRVSGGLSDEEVTINERLARDGFVNRARLIGLERVAADYRSRLAQAGSDLAQARQRIAELQSRIAQLRATRQTQATDELKEATTNVRELEERLRPSKDQVERQVVRAPVDGNVMSLHVAAPGAVVAPRETLLEVVPQREKLVIDARIDPQDIEHVAVGGAAEVRLISADARRAPLLPAKITFVSADRVTQPETGKSWFDVTVEVDERALRERQPATRLQAGMAAELYVTTGERTLLEYLAKPLRTFLLHAVREPG